MTERIIARMARTFRRELREADLNERHVLDGVPELLLALQTVGRTVFERWAALVEGERPAELQKQMMGVGRSQRSAAAQDAGGH